MVRVSVPLKRDVEVVCPNPLAVRVAVQHWTFADLHIPRERENNKPRKPKPQDCTKGKTSVLIDRLLIMPQPLPNSRNIGF